MSGGSSRQQELAMEHDAPGYPLELRFFEGGRAYAPADVPVRIKDGAGNVVLDTTSYGDLLLAKLPDGRYTVTAWYSGKAETLDADVRYGKRTMLAFDWKR